MKSLRNKIRQKWIFIKNLLEDDAGLSVVEMILILVGILTPYYTVCMPCME